MILQIVRLKSQLDQEDLMTKAREREPEFKKIPRLLQKYYVKMEKEGTYGGIYVWDTLESIQSFKESDLARSIPKAYEVIEAPQIELMDILFQLRE